MKYMVAELQFIAKKAWYENGMICISLEDEREIRFPVHGIIEGRFGTAGQIKTIKGRTLTTD